MMNGISASLHAAAIAALLVLAGCESSSTPTDGLTSAAGTTASIAPGAREGNIRVVAELPPPLNSFDGAEQPISSNDVLEIDVFEVNDLDRTVQVDSRGRISLPLVGEIEAAGKTVRALEQEIRNRYGASYLQNPQISVFVKESAGQRVTIDGEVSKPGIYPVTASASLVGVIAQSGGLNQIADNKKVYVFRPYGTEKLVANFDLDRIRKGEARDPRVFGGDIVVVFPSSTKVAMRNLREVLGVASSGVGLIP